LERILSPNYVVTEQDYLRCYVKTTGVSEMNFDVPNHNLK